MNIAEAHAVVAAYENGKAHWTFGKTRAAVDAAYSLLREANTYAHDDPKTLPDWDPDGDDDGPLPDSVDESVALLDSIDPRCDNAPVHEMADGILMKQLRKAGLGELSDAFERARRRLEFYYE